MEASQGGGGGETEGMEQASVGQNARNQDHVVPGGPRPVSSPLPCRDMWPM